jgi:hypothetical protein
VAVSRERELGLQLGLLQFLLDLEVEGIARQKTPRSDAVQHRRCRHDDHLRLALRNAPERGQPFADQVLVRRKTVVGQRFPVRKEGAAQIGREKCNLFNQPLRVRGIGGDDGGEPALRAFAPGELRQQQSIGRARRTW